MGKTNLCPRRTLLIFLQILTYSYKELEIKQCGLGSRIWDVEGFWYKTEIKHHLLCAIVFDCIDCVWVYGLLVWPQWWSWGDVSQQGVDFSKKISKIKFIFWFDFHRCSHGPSKIRCHFRNKSCSILKLSKSILQKMWS